MHAAGGGVHWPSITLQAAVKWLCARGKCEGVCHPHVLRQLGTCSGTRMHAQMHWDSCLIVAEAQKQLLIFLWHGPPHHSKSVERAEGEIFRARLGPASDTLCVAPAKWHWPQGPPAFSPVF